jgi:3-dehydroquinate dehydratase/shikimate dehydrogenase
MPAADPLTLFETFGKNVIYTCRRKCDGGAFEGSEEERVGLLKQAAAIGARYIDVEIDVLESGGLGAPSASKLIASFHDTSGTPADLDAVLSRLENTAADVVKLAVTPGSHADCARVLGLHRRASKPCVLIAMGELGFPTRILGKKLGAAWTYAAANAGPPAPGMPALAELRETYRYEEIGPATRVFGVAGDPVSGSAGMRLFNRAFREAGIDAAYLPFLSRDLAGLVEAYGPLGLEGLSVTHPLKEEAFRIAGQNDETVKRIGAANTLKITNGRVEAFTFDGPAALAALSDAVDGLAGKRVLLLGAGGAARAAADALARAGYEITITSRTIERAENLAKLVGAAAVSWHDRENVEADIVINATPLGMFHLPGTPLSPAFFKKGMLVMDMVYNPEQTRMLADASAAGARVLGGREMYIRQAEEQFYLWTGQKADFSA